MTSTIESVKRPGIEIPGRKARVPEKMTVFKKIKVTSLYTIEMPGPGPIISNESCPDASCPVSSCKVWATEKGAHTCPTPQCK